MQSWTELFQNLSILFSGCRLRYSSVNSYSLPRNKRIRVRCHDISNLGLFRIPENFAPGKAVGTILPPTVNIGIYCESGLSQISHRLMVEILQFMRRTLIDEAVRFDQVFVLITFYAMQSSTTITPYLQTVTQFLCLL